MFLSQAVPFYTLKGWCTMPTHGLGSAAGCTVLSKLLPWSGTLLSSVTSGMNLIITLGQSTAKRSWARILGFSIAFCLLVSTQATLCERDHPFSVPQLPSPLKKRNSSLYVHSALCSVDDNIWAGAKPCSAEAHGLCLLPQDLAAH